MTSDTDLGEVWARSLDELSDLQIEPHQRAWLRLTRPLGLVENTALIATPNEFVKEQLETRLRALITHALSRGLGRNIQLAVTVDPAAVGAPAAPPLPASVPGELDQPGQVPVPPDAGSPPLPGGAGGQEYGGPAGGPPVPGGPALGGPAAAGPAPDRLAPPPDGHGQGHLTGLPPRPNGQPSGNGPALTRPAPAQARLNPKYTFETFVIGSSNRFAHAAAVAVAEAPAKAYNPLFIYGDSGLGKTHLLHAIGHYAQSLYQVRVRYVSSEEFTNDFINMIRDGKQDGFRRRYRDVDVLLVDLSLIHI